MSTHEILPVNMHRLLEIFETLGAEYALINKSEDSDDLVLQTGLPHITIHFDIEDDTLSAFATWEGRIPPQAEDKVCQVVGDFNWDMVAPTLTYSFAEDGRGKPEIVLCANRAMGIAEGLSRNQLGAFVLSAFESFNATFEAMEQAFPKSAAWVEAPAAPLTKGGN